jgi:hypothetical protein
VLTHYLSPHFMDILQNVLKEELKGLILMVCGPAMTVPSHFDEVQELVMK